MKEGNAVVPWQTAADFRSTLLPPSTFSSVYSPRTRQNHAHEPGLYCFFLRKGWDVRSLAAGEYALEVNAEDTRGNGSLATLPLRVNHS